MGMVIAFPHFTTISIGEPSLIGTTGMQPQSWEIAFTLLALQPHLQSHELVLLEYLPEAGEIHSRFQCKRQSVTANLILRV